MKTNPKKLILTLTFALLLLLAIITVFLHFQQNPQISVSADSFTESSSPLKNPYQGLYRIYGYLLTDTRTVTEEEVAKNTAQDSNSRLALLEINLKEYRDTPISKEGLKNLDTLFSSWSKSNKQLIVRFLYDWDGKAPETEPEHIDRILEHMTQVGEIVNRHSDQVYILQGIFVGNCGEMNNSRYMTDESLCCLMEHLASVIDPSIYLSVRTPAHWRTVNRSFDAPEAGEAFSDSLRSRIGLFNDGMLGSANDLGTYGELPYKELNSYHDKADREGELAFQNKLCEYVPNGGEIVLDNPYNDLENAIADLSAMHVSYLDYDYDTAVLDKWKSSTYQESGSVFDGMSGYDYIGEHLGYRYVFRSLDLDYDPDSGKKATLTLEIENTGFANSLRKFKPEILLENTETSETFPLSTDTDSRFWKSLKKTDVAIPLQPAAYQEGSYRIFFKLTDSSTGETIRFANTLPLSEKGYEIGRLDITK